MTGNSIETIVDAMTLEEQVSLLSGEDFWSLPAIPRLASASCASPTARTAPAAAAR